MLKLFRVATFLGLSTFLSASPIMDFDFIKKGKDNNNTMLVIGGIQGDEPGGFVAASVLSTHYKINKGSLWIVPNLNFYSIIRRDRGPYGDMNRKFAYLPKKDPEFPLVQRIKSLITAPDVKLVVNLHDGSGYYREKHIDASHQPHKWGQCSVIDQKEVNVSKYGNLEEISQSIVDTVNTKALREEEKYRVHNTHTAEGDKEMEKSLTYYAINHGKAAFGNEATKNLPTHKRVYYHLLALEKYMQIVGIEFKRDFELTPKGVKDAINKNIFISLYDNKIKLPLSEVRNKLNYIPITKDFKVKFEASNPLLTVLKKGNYYQIQYGNRRLSMLKADYMDYDESNLSVQLEIDGKLQDYNFGSIIEVNDNFLVKDSKNYRVNVIGFVGKNKKETDIKIKKSNIIKKFSVDKSGTIYRVEYYKGKKFAGMILVRFKHKS
jgi:hypothetical protein